jgi:hypothetical protein
MTYKELKAHIEVMDEEQLNQDVTLFDTEAEEFYPVNDIDFAPETDVLDKNHPYLTFATNFNY